MPDQLRDTRPGSFLVQEPLLYRNQIDAHFLNCIIFAENVSVFDSIQIIKINI